jgi:glucose-6-phosphate isomerase
MANMFAQSEALAAGRPDTGDGHRSFPGNRPSTVVMMDALGPRTLGALVAMYEHSTAVQGWMMGVNSFDQWGVELGKVVASSVAEYLRGGSVQPSTLTHPLIDWFRARR